MYASLNKQLTSFQNGFAREGVKDVFSFHVSIGNTTLRSRQHVAYELQDGWDWCDMSCNGYYHSFGGKYKDSAKK